MNIFIHKRVWHLLMSCHTFFVALLLLVPHFLFAQNQFSPSLQDAYSELCKMRVQSAKQILSKENPNNSFKIWLDDYAEMIPLLANENYNSYEILKENEQKRLDFIEKIDKNSPNYRFLKAEIILHWALVKMKFGHEIKAAWSIISAYRLLEENQKLYPTHTPNLKYLGVLHILIGSVPENYTWAAHLMGLNGSINKGLQELQIAEKDKVFGTESKFYELFIQAFLLNFSEQKNQELLKFIEQNTDNQAINFLGVAISLKNNKGNQAQKILANHPTGEQYQNLPILEFYRGDIFLGKSDYQNAIKSYQSYLNVFQGKSFLKEGNYKISLANWLLGNENNAILAANKIPKSGNTVAEADKFAQNFYENLKKGETFPNKHLLKARLEFDGGFYEEASKNIGVLSENSFSNQKDKAEFCYRKGRINQKLNNFDLSIAAFQRAIAFNENQNWHFGASSALQLGYIFLEKKEKKQAKLYFEKAISYKKHEYKNSVDNKAKAALNEFF